MQTPQETSSGESGSLSSLQICISEEEVLRSFSVICICFLRGVCIFSQRSLEWRGRCYSFPHPGISFPWPLQPHYLKCGRIRSGNAESELLYIPQHLGAHGQTLFKKKKKTLQGDRELQQLKTLETASEAVSHLLCLEIGLIPGIDVLYINRAMKRSKGC